MNTQPNVQFFTPDQLQLSGFNPRQVVSDEYIADLAESIRAVGLVQSLAGIQTETGVEIVAGGCRLRALQKLADEGVVIDVPVQIAPDADTAQVWGAAENAVRRELKPGSIIRHGRAMLARGRGIADLCKMFAIPSNIASQYIALADLPDRVIDALDAEEISFDHAKVLTMCNDPDRLNELLDSAIKGTHPYQLRDAIDGDIQSSDYRVKIVGIDACEAAGMEVVRDLFSDRSSLKGEDILDRIYAEHVEKLVEHSQGEGWAFVRHLCEERSSRYDVVKGYVRATPDVDALTADEIAELNELMDKSWQRDDDEDARFDELDAKNDAASYSDDAKAITGMVLYLTYSGSIDRVEGLVGPDQADAAFAKGLITADDHKRLCEDGAGKGDGDGDGAPDDKPDPMALSNALRAECEQARLLALMNKAMTKPELMLDILAFHLAGERSPYSRCLDVSAEFNADVPDKMDCPGVSDELIDKPDRFDSMGKSFDHRKTFHDYRARGKASRNADIALHLARSLNITSATGRELAGDLEDLAGSNMRQVWTPTAENFFGRVTAPYLDALYADLLDLDNEDQRRKDFGKMKKGAKAKHMAQIFAGSDLDVTLSITGAQRKKIDAWMPDV